MGIFPFISLIKSKFLAGRNYCVLGPPAATGSLWLIIMNKWPLYFFQFFFSFFPFTLLQSFFNNI